MSATDFSGTSRAAFFCGFLKGMAAPAALFPDRAVPELPQVALIVPPQRPQGDAGALTSDWVRIGMLPGK